MSTITENIQTQQPMLYQKFSQVFKQHKVSHAYIIQGSSSEEEEQMALFICQGLFCENLSDEGSPCGNCRSCQRIEQDEHADIATLAPDGQTIKVDQIRQIKSFFTSSGVESRRKVLIVSESEKMTVQSANSLLKFIEEPDGELFIFFLTNNVMSLLPTIQSRCQLITLKQLSKVVLKDQLLTTTDTPANIDLLVELTNSLNEAQELSKDEWFISSCDVASRWIQYMEKQDTRSFIFVQQYLIKQVQDKEQQRFFFDIIIAMLKCKMRSQINTQFSNGIDYVKMIMNATEAKQKLASNVSFQNTCEQLAWKITTSH